MNKIICGDVLDVLKTLEPESVQCVVTSPPYWGLRDYGVTGQIGLEKKPEEYVSKIVEVFKEAKRVLHQDGTLWLNLGDSYAGSMNGSNDHRNEDSSISKNDTKYKGQKPGLPAGLKPKDLCGIPWRVAFALQADGWYLRSDIIWAKPNPMPESVTDRPTKAHEYIFLLTKSASYYYDAEAIKDPLQESSISRNQSGWNGNEDRDYVNGKQNHMSKYLGSEKAKIQTHRNQRSVWTIATNPYPEAHFATFPEEIPLICIKAGSKEGDTVLDPFSGAGTTCMVAKKLNRKYIGIELNPKYVDMSELRIETECGTLI